MSTYIHTVHTCSQSDFLLQHNGLRNEAQGEAIPADQNCLHAMSVIGLYAFQVLLALVCWCPLNR